SLLADTYGVIVYQEQVMQIAQVLSGYSLGRADLLRRAMGKKNKETMDKEKAGFVEGAVAKGVDAKIADSIFELIAFFAGYGFNRSHSAAYGWITYQTAYLKHHFPHEFMAGLMSCDADNVDNIVKFIAEARSMGLVVERPDVDESAADFTVTPRVGAHLGKVIRFGLGAVKGVGLTAVDSVLEARKDGGAFNSVYDFCRRVDTQRCNRRVIEALVKSGAFDGVAAIVGLHRARLLGSLDAALEAGAAEQRDRKSGQTSLFGLIVEAAPAGPGGAAGAGGSVMAPEIYPELEPWTAKQLLAFEKEALGFYISGHPLDRYRSDLSRYATATTSDFVEGRRQAGEASVGGVVAQYREMITKKGDKMARFILEDQGGGIEVVCFPKTFEKVRHVLVCDEPILCTGKVQNEGTAEQADWKILLENATPIAELRAAKTSRVAIHLNADSVTREQIAELKTILMGAPRGQCQAVVMLAIPSRSETVIALGERWMVSPSDELLGRLERVFGDRVATLA
ncbi:MAG TPA: OB-fold nucleic acid binding domain-containing protein, partial [Kofleriaceae bacterium]|nr:OB-fold nucleic acid binding domain-containing protein [Kofleriaceae bacterium]